jgi:hypothetical protein
MKVKIGLIFGLIFSANAITAEVAICEKTGLPKIANESVTDIMKPMKTLTDDEIEVIAQKLCVNIIVARSGEFQKDKFNNIILDSLEVSSSTSSKEKNEIISNFLNTNKQKLICKESEAKANDRDLHFFKTAALEGIIDLYDENQKVLVKFNDLGGFDLFVKDKRTGKYKEATNTSFSNSEYEAFYRNIQKAFNQNFIAKFTKNLTSHFPKQSYSHFDYLISRT